MQPPGDLLDIGGRRLHCRIRGEGGPTVLIESGGGGGSSIQDWPVQDRVASLTRSVTYDRAGLGWSDPAPGPRRLAGMAGDLAALLGALAEPFPVVLAGGSFGGLVVQAFARLHREKVAGMVLIDACDDQKYFGTMQRMRSFHEEELRREIPRAARGDLRREAEPQIRRARSLDEGAKLAALHILGLASHFEASLAELQVLDGAMPPLPAGEPPLADAPLIVLSHGRPYEGEMTVWEDGWREAQARLAALSSRGVHIVAEGCGHSIAQENPALVAAAITAVVRAARGQAFDCAEVLSRAGGTAAGDRPY